MRKAQEPTGPSGATRQAIALLEQVMAEQHMSAKRLGERSGVQDTTIGRILRGTLVPSLDLLDKLFAGLGYETSIEINYSAGLAHEADVRRLHK